MSRWIWMEKEGETAQRFDEAEVGIRRGQGWTVMDLQVEPEVKPLDDFEDDED